MNYIFILALLFTSGCASMSDLKESRSELLENAKVRKVYSSIRTAARATVKGCQRPDSKERWLVEVGHQSHIVKQGKGNVGYFKTLCFSKTAKYKKLDIVGVHLGGGMGKAFFMLPKISIFNNRWKLVKSNLSRIKQNVLSGNLEAEMSLSRLSDGEYVVVVEADNRSGENTIGEYVQGTYAVVPIITSVDMYSMPTGKARLYLKEK